MRKFFPILIPFLLIAMFFTDSVSAQTKRTFYTVAEAGEITIPIVPGPDDNLVLRIRLNLEKAVVLKQIQLSLLHSFSSGDIQTINIYATGKSPDFSRDSMLFGTISNPGKTVKIPGNKKLIEGENYLWAAVTLKPGASLLGKLSIKCNQLLFDRGTIIPVQGETKTIRAGLVVRHRGYDNVNTYRIPGLATTPKGTLLGVYDIRYNNSADLQGHVDVGLSRSTDGGNTWEPMKVIMDMGTWGGLPQDQNGIGDPSILIDPARNTIWVAALWAHGMPNQRTWTASAAGMAPVETGQFMLAKSTDDGITWSEPVNITPQVKQPHWKLMFQGPGVGITMRDGTLVFPAQYIDSSNLPYSTLIYSKDGGNTWKAGTGARSNTTEAQIVELLDGSLMLNMRDNRGGSRAVAITKDLGQTWTEHASSRSALPEPICMASLVRFNFKNADGTIEPILLFSNPASTKDRNNITIKISRDEGLSWPSEYHILLDEGYGWGYSCLTQIDVYTVGILYESSKAHMLFQKIDLREVIKK